MHTAQNTDWIEAVLLALEEQLLLEEVLIRETTEDRAKL